MSPFFFFFKSTSLLIDKNIYILYRFLFLLNFFKRKSVFACFIFKYKRIYNVLPNIRHDMLGRNLEPLI